MTPRQSRSRLDLWFLVLGSWFLVLGSWFLVLGSWFLVFGFWFIGSWFLVLGSSFLTPHKLRIKRPRLGDVVCAFDDRPAVREDGEFVTLGREPEHERVVANVAEGGEPG